jgi:hypothetical protein
VFVYVQTLLLAALSPKSFYFVDLREEKDICEKSLLYRKQCRLIVVEWLLALRMAVTDVVMHVQANILSAAGIESGEETAMTGEQFRQYVSGLCTRLCR